MKIIKNNQGKNTKKKYFKFILVKARNRDKIKQKI